MNIPDEIFNESLDDLSPFERLIYLFLVATPEGHYSGFFRLPLRRIAYWTGILAPTIKKHLRKLKPLVLFDEGSSIFYLPGLLKKRAPKGLTSHQEKEMVEQVEITRKFEKSHPTLSEAFLDDHADWGFVQKIERLPKIPLVADYMFTNPLPNQLSNNSAENASQSIALWEGPPESEPPPSIYIYNPESDIGNEGNLLTLSGEPTPMSVEPPSMLLKGLQVSRGGGYKGGETILPDYPLPSQLTKPSERLTPESLMDLWVDILPLGGNGRLIMTPERRKRMRLRLMFQPSREFWTTVFDKIKHNTFLRGESNPERPWKATLDWCIQNDTNPAKIYEGKYDRNDVRQDTPASAKPKACPKCKGSGRRLEFVDAKTMKKVRCECQGGPSGPSPSAKSRTANDLLA